MWRKKKSNLSPVSTNSSVSVSPRTSDSSTELNLPVIDEENHGVGNDGMFLHIAKLCLHFSLSTSFVLYWCSAVLYFFFITLAYIRHKRFMFEYEKNLFTPGIFGQGYFFMWCINCSSFSPRIFISLFRRKIYT